jgi:hypothetical protein
MKLFSDCSGPCETCRIYHLGVICLAGHGDNDYVYADPEWIAVQKRKVNQSNSNKNNAHTCEET